MWTREHTQDMLERALWTFIQAFAAVVLITPISNWKAALAAGLAAGVSAVKTLIVGLL